MQKHMPTSCIMQSGSACLSSIFQRQEETQSSSRLEGHEQKEAPIHLRVEPLSQVMKHTTQLTNCWTVVRTMKQIKTRMVLSLEVLHKDEHPVVRVCKMPAELDIRGLFVGFWQQSKTSLSGYSRRYAVKP